MEKLTTKINEMSDQHRAISALQNQIKRSPDRAPRDHEVSTPPAFNMGQVGYEPTPQPRKYTPIPYRNTRYEQQPDRPTQNYSPRAQAQPTMAPTNQFTPRNRVPRCDACFNLGHTRSQCRQFNSGKQCDLCQKFGHNTDECWFAKQNQGKNDRDQNNYGPNRTYTPQRFPSQRYNDRRLNSNSQF